jgi:outer membrane protein assembly factor BamD
MTVLQTWRVLRGSARTPALIVALAVALQLVGCSSPPKDEGSAATAERLYKEAKEDMDSGSYERAIKTLERVEGLAAGSTLSQQALLDMAYLQWKSGERTTALSSIDRFIKLNPSSPAFDYALYLRGTINFIGDLGFLSDFAGQDVSERDQAASREAYQSFKQLIEQYPDSRYSSDARLRMNHIVNSLGAYEVNVARYYLRRGAYVAAAARAQRAVQEFQQTAATEEALYIMVESYERLELPALRDDALRVLKQNFPNSEFLTRGLAARDKAAPWWRIW